MIIYCRRYMQTTTFEVAQQGFRLCRDDAFRDTLKWRRMSPRKARQSRPRSCRKTVLFAIIIEFTAMSAKRSGAALMTVCHAAGSNRAVAFSSSSRPSRKKNVEYRLLFKVFLIQMPSAIYCRLHINRPFSSSFLRRMHFSMLHGGSRCQQEIDGHESCTISAVSLLCHTTAVPFFALRRPERKVSSSSRACVPAYGRSRARTRKSVMLVFSKVGVDARPLCKTRRTCRPMLAVDTSAVSSRMSLRNEL